MNAKLVVERLIEQEGLEEGKFATGVLATALAMLSPHQTHAAAPGQQEKPPTSQVAPGYNRGPGKQELDDYNYVKSGLKQKIAELQGYLDDLPEDWDVKADAQGHEKVPEDVALMLENQIICLQNCLWLAENQELTGNEESDLLQLDYVYLYLYDEWYAFPGAKSAMEVGMTLIQDVINKRWPSPPPKQID